MQIPTVSEEPVKSLGKLFSGNLKVTTAGRGTKEDLNTWLSAGDGSGLPGKFKAWIYQRGILPCLLWPPLVYEDPITIMDLGERLAGFCIGGCTSHRV